MAFPYDSTCWLCGREAVSATTRPFQSRELAEAGINNVFCADCVYRNDPDPVRWSRYEKVLDLIQCLAKSLGDVDERSILRAVGMSLEQDERGGKP